MRALGPSGRYTSRSRSVRSLRSLLLPARYGPPEIFNADLGCRLGGRLEVPVDPDLGRVGHLEERLPRVRRLPSSKLVHISTLYSDEEKETPLVYNKALPLTDTCDSLNVRFDGPDGSRIVWVAADPVGGAGWSSSQVETVAPLPPHIRQFVRVRQALVDARALGASLAALPENTRCGVIQLDLYGRIVAANARARDPQADALERALLRTWRRGQCGRGVRTHCPVQRAGLPLRQRER